jgi:hypothetical protein
VVEVVKWGDGCQLPLQFVEDEQFPFLKERKGVRKCVAFSLCVLQYFTQTGGIKRVGCLLR